MGLLDAVKSILPSTKYRIFLTDVPSEGDCLVISQSDIRPVSAHFNTRSSEWVCRLHFFLRVKPRSGSDYAQSVEEDLVSYYSLIDDCTYQTVQNYLVLLVTTPTITPSGRDKDGNLVFSMEFEITYKGVG